MRRRDFLLTPLLWPALARADSGQPGATYPAVIPGATLSFPRDHGAHPDFRTEWWYVTGALQTLPTARSPTQELGFQLTFFRTRPGQAEGLASPLAASQILFAHAAVARPGVGLQHAERAARANLGGGFSTADCDLHIGNWSMRRSGAGAQERLQLLVHDAAFAFDLTLAPTQPPWLQGDQGYSRKGAEPRHASYYLSWPQLEVNGSLVLDGRRQPARGRAWFDHEWSSQVLAPGSVGWDWVGINLDDGGALMAFRIRDAAGRTVYAHAALRDASGKRQQFGAGEVVFTPLRTWTSPRNGASYPVQIEIRCGPHTVRTTPLLDDQEIVGRRPKPISYWEGLVSIDGSLSGRGYLEMTGYAAAIEW